MRCLSPRSPFLAVAVLAITANSAPLAHGQEAARRLLLRGKFADRIKLVKVGIGQAKLMEMNAENLGLSEETNAALSSLIEEIETEEDGYLRQMVALSDEIESLMDEPLPDEDALLKKTKEINDVWLKRQLAQIRYAVKARALLSPEQLEQFMAIRAAKRTESRQGPAAGQETQPKPDTGTIAPGVPEQAPTPEPP